LKYKIIENFAGVVSGRMNEIITITDKEIANDLLAARYIEPVKTTAAKGRSKDVETDES